MNKNVLVIILVLIIIILGVFLLAGNNEPAEPIGIDNNPPLSVVAESEELVIETTVIGRPFSFTPNEITVKKGEAVRLTFQNAEGTHDWVIDEFNARTKVIQAGAEETIEFVANQAGTFEYYCSVGDHRARGMVGKLIVE